MKIDELLKNYKRNISRIEFIKMKIKNYEDDLMKDIFEINESIEKPRYENLGISRGSRVSNPTENLVINAETKKEEYQEKIENLRSKLLELEKEIKIIDNLIQNLDEESKMLITQKIFENKKWHIITFKFNAEFRNEYKDYITISGIRKKYYRILESLSTIYQENYK